MTDFLKSLADLVAADGRLEASYSDKIVVNQHLRRTLVSFQANKHENGYKWHKYKEGFSASLVRYLLHSQDISSGKILDPFAGSGTSLFASSELGLDATGVELLPNAIEIIEVRSLLEKCDKPEVAKAIRKFTSSQVWEKRGKSFPFPHLRITSGAFPPETEKQLGRYLFEVANIRDEVLRRVLRFGCLCILEAVSYTRKDGQYLRWDSRSGRRAGGKPFDKGTIATFGDAITTKLAEIADDLTNESSLFGPATAGLKRGQISVMRGSCLNVLANIKAGTFDGIITSPPYCNRYDYTRTYALELAMLGVDEAGIRELRQAMLSCTVENREKENLKEQVGEETFKRANSIVQSHEALQGILNYLEVCREAGTLNNTGIPRMVQNYFREMCCVLIACRRLLRRNGWLLMVNDNVRYQGAHIPVDLILSDFAKASGFRVEKIWVLPRGKGNSSQQMGVHGRTEIRKCVYVWRATNLRATQPSSPPVVRRLSLRQNSTYHSEAV